MVHPLYWICDLVFVVCLMAIYLHDRILIDNRSEIEKSYRRLIRWIIIFCLQDTFWGLSASDLIINDTILIISSVIFHMSTVITCYYLVSFINAYTGKVNKLYMWLVYSVITLQVILLTMNFYKPTVFYIGSDGSYCTTFLRPLAFANQYILYLIIALKTIVDMIKTHEIHNNMAVFSFVMGPVLTGAFQFLYPDAPFHAIGYFIGCIIINTYLVSEDRQKVSDLKHELEISDEHYKAHNDALTGLGNRRAYEEMILLLDKMGTYSYLSVDVNELKTINDRYGHQFGDIYLCEAAKCLNQCLGAYGSVYRVGGDEFVCVMNVDMKQLAEINEDLKIVAENWNIQSVKGLHFSVGISTNFEFPSYSIEQLAKIADERMYQDKARYYLEKGIDRRGVNSVLEALKDSYQKILKVNLSDDSYICIKLMNAEKDTALGYNTSLSKWLRDFGKSGQVANEDLDEYLRKTDLNYISEYLKEHDELSIFYSRKYGDEFKQTMMQIIKADLYNEKYQVVYLFVKRISD